MAIWKTVTVEPSGGDYTSLSSALDTEGDSLTPTDLATANNGCLKIELHAGTYSGEANLIESMTTRKIVDLFVEDADNAVVIVAASGDECLGKFRTGADPFTGALAGPTVAVTGNNHLEIGSQTFVSDWCLNKGDLATGAGFAISFRDAGLVGGTACIRRMVLGVEASNTRYQLGLIKGPQNVDAGTTRHTDNSSDGHGDISFCVTYANASMTQPLAHYGNFNGERWCNNTHYALDTEEQFNMEQDSRSITYNTLIYCDADVRGNDPVYQSGNFRETMAFKNNVTLSHATIADLTTLDADPQIANNYGTDDGYGPSDLEDASGGDLHPTASSDLGSAGLNLNGLTSWFITHACGDDGQVDVELTALPASGEDWFVGAFTPTGGGGGGPSPTVHKFRRSMAALPLPAKQ